MLDLPSYRQVTQTSSGFFQANKTGRYQFKFRQDPPFAIQGSLPSILQSNNSPYHKHTMTQWTKPPSRQQRVHVKHIDFQPLFIKDMAQRKHITPRDSGHAEDLVQGIRTFTLANKESNELNQLEHEMGKKIRIPTLQEKRNKIPLRVLGDKEYVSPEHQQDFFKQNDSLVPGFNIKLRTRYPFKISKKFH